MNESDKTTIGKMMLLLNDYQRRAFLSLYCEKLGYRSNLTGISFMTLIA